MAGDPGLLGMQVADVGACRAVGTDHAAPTWPRNLV